MSNEDLVSIEYLMSKPVAALELIGSRVECITISKSEKVVSGFLRTIDPVEGHLVIFDIDDQKNIQFIQIVTSRCVKELKILQRNACSLDMVNNLFSENKTELDLEELQNRKKNIMQLIKSNRLPFVENDDDSLLIASSATINPPYAIDDLVCKNDIVLKRIRQIIFSQ